MAFSGRLRVAVLTPAGRAPHRADLTLAHDIGALFAENGAQLNGIADGGEMIDAFASGVVAAGAEIALYALPGAKALKPKGAGRIDLRPVADATGLPALLGNGVHASLAFAPLVADLKRYLSVWAATRGCPAICVSTGDEFRLLRGFIDDVASVGRPADAERIGFAHTPQETWDSLTSRLGSKG